MPLLSSHNRRESLQLMWQSKVLCFAVNKTGVLIACTINLEEEFTQGRLRVCQEGSGIPINSEKYTQNYKGRGILYIQNCQK